MPEAPDLRGVFDGALTWTDLSVAGAIVVVSFALARVARRVVRRVVANRASPGVSNGLARATSYVVFLIGLFTALSLIGLRIGPLLGALGIGGLVLALAVQGLLENVFAGIVLQARNEFRVGDQVLTNGEFGVVQEVNGRALVMRKMNGEHVFIPNMKVLTEPLTNVTKESERRTSLTVGVEYATPLERARDVLIESVRGVDGVRGEVEAYVVEFGDSSIDFIVRFWHLSDDLSMHRVRSRVAMAIKSSLDAAGITIAFPQRTVWFGQDA